MNKNIKVAKELIKLAKSLVAGNSWQKLDYYNSKNESPEKQRAKFFKESGKFQRFMNGFCKSVFKNITKKDPQFDSLVNFQCIPFYRHNDDTANQTIELLTGMELKSKGKYVDANDNAITIPEMSLILSYKLNLQNFSVLIVPFVKFGEKQLVSKGWGSIVTTNVENMNEELQKMFMEKLKVLEGEIAKTFDANRGDKRIAKNNNRIMLANIIAAIEEACEDMNQE